MHYGATLLDLLYYRAHVQDHDLDSDHLRNLIERGARLFSTNVPTYPCTLVNDCAQFHLILLEYNCSTMIEKVLFIFHLLNSISMHPDDVLRLKRKHEEFINTCDYFFKVVQIAHYYYQIDRLFVTIEQRFLPQLMSQQSSEQVEILRRQIEQLRSTPLKLSQIARKVIRQKFDTPCKTQLKSLGLTKHLLDFLVQTAF